MEQIVVRSRSLSESEQKFIKAVRMRDSDAALKIFRQGRVDVNCFEDKHHWSAIHYAAGNGFIEVVRLLVDECGADLNLQAKGGYTALHYAAIQGYTQVVTFLLKTNKVQLDVADSKEQLTALHYAARHGHLDIVELLVQAGCNLRATDTDGLTAMDLCLALGRDDIADFLRIKILTA